MAAAPRPAAATNIADEEAERGAVAASPGNVRPSGSGGTTICVPPPGFRPVLLAPLPRELAIVAAASSSASAIVAVAVPSAGAKPRSPAGCGGDGGDSVVVVVVVVGVAATAAADAAAEAAAAAAHPSAESAETGRRRKDSGGGGGSAPPLVRKEAGMGGSLPTVGGVGITAASVAAVEEAPSCPGGQRGGGMARPAGGSGSAGFAAGSAPLPAAAAPSLASASTPATPTAAAAAASAARCASSSATRRRARRRRAGSGVRRRRARAASASAGLVPPTGPLSIASWERHTGGAAAGDEKSEGVGGALVAPAAAMEERGGKGGELGVAAAWASASRIASAGEGRRGMGKVPTSELKDVTGRQRTHNLKRACGEAFPGATPKFLVRCAFAGGPLVGGKGG